MVADAVDPFELPPERVAVVLIDFQNDFCSPDVAAAGRPVPNSSNAAAAVRANRYAAVAAQLGAHVVYTRIAFVLAALSTIRKWSQV